MIRIYPVKLGFVHSFLVKTGNGLILVDAGYRNKETLLWKFLGEKGFAPTDVKLIIITHGHMDHVGSLKAIREKTGAKVMIHSSEGGLLRQGRSPGIRVNLKWIGKFIGMKNGIKVIPVEPDILITEDYSLENFGVDGKVILTPGHTKGSISVILEGKHAIIGDIAMKFPLLSRTYEPIIADDIPTVFQSWRRIIAEGVETIYPAHGRIIGVEALKEILSVQK
jgi:hydroxyacylglutathione hydrolase